jgi:hypothetical protein
MVLENLLMPSKSGLNSSRQFGADRRAVNALMAFSPTHDDTHKPDTRPTSNRAIAHGTYRAPAPACRQLYHSHP